MCSRRPYVAYLRKRRLEMPENRDATGILKPKLEAYRCGSRGSRCRDCRKNVVVRR